MNVSHFVTICQVLTILYQLICRSVANFGTQCKSVVSFSAESVAESQSQMRFGAF